MGRNTIIIITKNITVHENFLVNYVLAIFEDRWDMRNKWDNFLQQKIETERNRIGCQTTTTTNKAVKIKLNH
jgi:hypothetical protein